MTRLRIPLALAAGVFLFAVPFLRYGAFGSHGAPHADHEPHHGGQLGMVGEHHLEIVRRDGRIEVFVSDAWRRPLTATRGSLRFDRAATRPLTWKGDRLVGTDLPVSRDVEATVVLADGTDITLGFDLDP